MDWLKQGIDIFLHLDVHMNDLATTLGPFLYVLLFAIIFCETGLVVTPFLPGDSLLFAVGALAALDGSPLQLPHIAALLCIAAILGDALNYAIGARIGPKVFSSETSRLLNKEHLVRTQHFYEKYGGKTIIIARFMPIIRTFAPFVAGIGSMTYPRFLAYNVIGGVAWIGLFVCGGYFFGNIPVVKRNFTLVIMAIIFLSILPGIIEYVRHRMRAQQVGVAE